METLRWVLCILAAYLIGSLNFAILITRLVRKTDIRSLGNRNPGAANVGRSLGTGWGAVVLLLDISKSLGPMLLARAVIPDSPEMREFLVALTVGMAAVIGHCKPLFYGFRGGRGIATSIGVYVMLVPLEAVVALFGAAGLVALLLRGVEHRFGPYTPVFFVVLAPLLTAATALWLDVPVSGRLGIGAHSWYEVVGVLALSLVILALNPTYLRHRLGDYRSGRSPAHADEES